MNTYSLNQNPIPQAPMTMEEHHRLLNMLIVLGAIAVIITMIFWWTTGSRSALNQTSDIRAQVAALLQSAPVDISQQEIDRVAAQLVSSKSTATPEQRQAVVNALK